MARVTRALFEALKKPGSQLVVVGPPDEELIRTTALCDRTIFWSVQDKSIEYRKFPKDVAAVVFAKGTPQKIFEVIQNRALKEGLKSLGFCTLLDARTLPMTLAKGPEAADDDDVSEEEVEKELLNRPEDALETNGDINGMNDSERLKAISQKLFDNMAELDAVIDDLGKNNPLAQENEVLKQENTQFKERVRQLEKQNQRWEAKFERIRKQCVEDETET